MDRASIGYSQILAAGLLAGFAPIFVRLIQNLNAESIAFFRIFLAAVFVGIFLFFYKRFVPLKYEIKKMILFGLLHAFILFAFFSAIKLLSIASAIFLMYGFPVWILLFSFLLLGDKPTKSELGGLLIALIGIGILFTPKNILSSNILGLVLGLAAGMGAGLVYVLSKTFKKYDKVSLTFWQNVLALPFIFILLFPNISNIGPISFSEVMLLLLLGLTASVSFILVFKGFEKLKANKAGIVMLFGVIWPILLAFLFFKEIPSVSLALAGVLIVTGAFLVTR